MKKAPSKTGPFEQGSGCIEQTHRRLKADDSKQPAPASGRVFAYSLYPLGLFDCQRQESSHMRAKSYSATQPSSSRALSQAA